MRWQLGEALLILFSLLAVPANSDLIDSLDGCPAKDTLNGFALVLSKDGDLIYLSDNVERSLGLANIDMIGHSIYDYSHPCDHDHVKAMLEPLALACDRSKANQEPKAHDKTPLLDVDQTFFIRMKSTLTNKGRSLNLKSANYKVCSSVFLRKISSSLLRFFLKVVKMTGKMVDLEVVCPQFAKTIGADCRQYMIAVGELIHQPAGGHIEIPFGSHVFMSKHSADMKFTYVDDRYVRGEGSLC